MSSSITITRPLVNRHFLRTGIAVGLAGGIAEIVVVGIYAALTGADAANVARQIGVAVGLSDASAATGIAIHLILAVMLGLGLTRLLQLAVAGRGRTDKIFLLSLVTLAAVWIVNFEIVLPAVSPGFVHLLPQAVTFASKLMFGVCAAATYIGSMRRL